MQVIEQTANEIEKHSERIEMHSIILSEGKEMNCSLLVLSHLNLILYSSPIHLT